MSKTALLNSKISFAEQSPQDHALQSKLSIILTDFEPNGNKQGIPKSEIDNIIRTALYQPIKIAFDGHKYANHIGANTIGPITKVYAGKDGDRDVIFAEAVLWNVPHAKITSHLKEVFSTKGISSSWEIYYGRSELDENGVEWLHDCVFGGQCIVQIPAYGPERTRVLAIAEAITNEEKMTNPLLASVQSLMQTLGLSDIPEGDEAVAEYFKNKALPLITQIKESSNQLDILKAELAELKQKEQDRALSELKEFRRAQLAKYDISFDNRADFYTNLSDGDFTALLEDLTIVKSKSVASLSTASEQPKPIVPEPRKASVASTESIGEIYRKLVLKEDK